MARRPGAPSAPSAHIKQGRRLQVVLCSAKPPRRLPSFFLFFFFWMAVRGQSPCCWNVGPRTLFKVWNHNFFSPFSSPTVSLFYFASLLWAPPLSIHHLCPFFFFLSHTYPRLFVPSVLSHHMASSPLSPPGCRPSPSLFQTPLFFFFCPPPVPSFNPRHHSAPRLAFPADFGVSVSEQSSGNINNPTGCVKKPQWAEAENRSFSGWVTSEWSRVTKGRI